MSGRSLEPYRPALPSPMVTDHDRWNCDAALDNEVWRYARRLAERATPWPEQAEADEVAAPPRRPAGRLRRAARSAGLLLLAGIVMAAVAGTVHVGGGGRLPLELPSFRPLLAGLLGAQEGGLAAQDAPALVAGALLTPTARAQRAPAPLADAPAGDWLAGLGARPVLAATARAEVAPARELAPGIRASDWLQAELVAGAALAATAQAEVAPALQPRVRASGWFASELVAGAALAATTARAALAPALELEPGMRASEWLDTEPVMAGAALAATAGASAEPALTSSAAGPPAPGEMGGDEGALAAQEPAASAVVPALAPPPASARPAAPYRVQLALLRNPHHVEPVWRTFLRRVGPLARDLERHVVPTRTARGLRHLVQAGPLADAGAAKALCARILAAGGDCLVVPPS